MRPHEIFAAMDEQHAEAVFRLIAEKSPAMFLQVVHAAAAALKSRPAFLLKQPFPKRVASVRRTLSRVNASPVAEEMLAVYFLECRVDLLTEWLDLVGLEHEDGMLKTEAPESPAEADLMKWVESYRSKEEDPDRELLLRAFASQSSIDWPVLDRLIATAE